MLPVLGVDADDTLWENEERFHEVEQRFRDLMVPWAGGDATDAALLTTERENIGRHGYGIKGFVLSMVLTAVEISDGAIDARSLAGIVGWGHEMMAHPIELLDGVPEALDDLGATH
ncbi:MAG: HAD family hydrolase, partial [Actinomycetota bacterium]|nr:HAD family hydrolase [Actinomycetota bacterium]